MKWFGKENRQLTNCYKVWSCFMCWRQCRNFLIAFNQNSCTTLLWPAVFWKKIWFSWKHPKLFMNERKNSFWDTSMRMLQLHVVKVGMSNQIKTKFYVNSYEIWSHKTTNTVVIIFVVSWWIINDFESYVLNLLNKWVHGLAWFIKSMTNTKNAQEKHSHAISLFIWRYTMWVLRNCYNCLREHLLNASKVVTV